MEERSSFALLVGTVFDATTMGAPFTPSPPRSPIRISFSGIGTPPAPSSTITARAFSPGGFVLAFDASNIAVDFPGSSGPSPKHLVGAFDVSFVVSADGYVDLPVIYSCNGNALPIDPPAYVLQPNAVTVRGCVTVRGVVQPGAAVQITAESPPLVSFPPAVTTDINGMYEFDDIPAAQTITINANSGINSATQTLPLDYPEPVITINFEF